MFRDLAIRLDPATGRCDLAFERGDLVVDRTPATAMLISLGTDQRAEADDVLPEGLTEESITTAARFDPRRGWAGDALDAEGRRIGGKLWLLSREKRSEDVRLRAIAHAEAALEWLREARGLEIEVVAGWTERGRLDLVARAGAVEVAAP